MTRDEAAAILELPRIKAIDTILALAEKAEKYDQLCGQVTPTTPSGMIAHLFKANPPEATKTTRKKERP